MTNNLAKLVKYFISFIFDDLKKNPVILTKAQQIKSDDWKISAKYNLANNLLDITIVDMNTKTTFLCVGIPYENIHSIRDVFFPIMEELQMIVANYNKIVNLFEDVLNEGL